MLYRQILLYNSPVFITLDKMAKKPANYLEKIYEASLKFLVPLTPEETYRTIVQEAMKLVGGESGVIVLEKNGKLQRVYKESPKGFPSLRMRKEGYTQKAFREQKALVVHSNELSKVRPKLTAAGVKSNAYIPLAYRNKSIGVLIIRSHSNGYFNQDEPLILQSFGTMASIAIRKAQLYDETIKALQTRDLFVSMAAHEFRTPLTTIGGYSQLLMSKLPTDTPQSKWAKELHWEVGRLTSLVNEFLDVSRIQGGKFHYAFQEHSLNQIIQKVISEFQFEKSEHKLIFRNKLDEAEDKIICDFEKILQMINNLVENAAKFSDPGKDIEITLTSKSPNLILIIKDYGIGISRRNKSRIFEAFFRRDDAERGGIGLGLFLAKSVVEAHRGIIKVYSKVGKGTSIEVKLPRVKYG